MILESIYLMGVTHHFQEDGLNAQNYGAIFESSGYVAGVYKNSYDDLSVIAASKYGLKTGWGFSTGVIVGAATNYSKDEVKYSYKGVSPMVAGYLQLDYFDHVQPVVIANNYLVSLALRISF
jgi:hypothetical protein